MTHHAHWRDVSPGHFASKHTDTDTDTDNWNKRTINTVKCYKCQSQQHMICHSATVLTANVDSVLTSTRSIQPRSEQIVLRAVSLGEPLSLRSTSLPLNAVINPTATQLIVLSWPRAILAGCPLRSIANDHPFSCLPLGVNYHSFFNASHRCHQL